MGIKFVNVSYKNIFKNVEITIDQKNITSIVSKNGMGKTRLLDIIFGLELDFEGEIKIDNRKLNNKNLNLIRNNISYLTQEYTNQLFNLNISDDIKYGVENLDELKLNELLKNFNLNDSILKENYLDLDALEKKKILLISTFISDKKILLLDDPTSGLDQKSISSLIKIIKKEKRSGKLIIICSQDVEFLLAVTDEMLLIDGNKIYKYDNKYEFFDNNQLLNKCGLEKPNILKFRELVLKNKNIKLMYRDNINDLIKDIYRNVK